MAEPICIFVPLRLTTEKVDLHLKIIDLRACLTQNRWNQFSVYIALNTFEKGQCYGIYKRIISICSIQRLIVVGLALNRVYQKHCEWIVWLFTFYNGNVAFRRKCENHTEWKFVHSILFTRHSAPALFFLIAPFMKVLLCEAQAARLNRIPEI